MDLPSEFSEKVEQEMNEHEFEELKRLVRCAGAELAQVEPPVEFIAHLERAVNSRRLDDNRSAFRRAFVYWSSVARSTDRFATIRARPSRWAY